MFKNKFSESDEIKMLTYTYVSKGKFELMEKPKPVLTHTYLLCRIEEAYELFENKRDGVIKVAVEC